MEEQRKAVRAMQVYIREHIAEEITPADLAKVSSYSPWYARKLFIKHLGTAPAVYIRRLRLSMSALRLREKRQLFWILPWKWDSEAWTVISALSDMNSAATPKHTP